MKYGRGSGSLLDLMITTWAELRLVDDEAGAGVVSCGVVSMEAIKPKPRRIETAEERAVRIDDANRRALDQALAEQDAIDLRIRGA